MTYLSLTGDTASDRSDNAWSVRCRRDHLDRGEARPVHRAAVVGAETRLIAPTLRNGEVAVGVAVSVAATASLYIPLNRLMDGPDLKMSSYAQYLMPLIVLQAIAFASISTAFRAATDSVQGINRRFQSLPIRR